MRAMDAVVVDHCTGEVGGVRGVGWGGGEEGGDRVRVGGSQGGARVSN